MSAFKDQVALDIKATFINEEEFGDKHIVNDVELIVVIDRHLVEKRELLFNRERSSSPAYGVFSDKIVMYVSLADLGYKPSEGEQMHIDEEHYFVVEVAEDMGMLTITLEGNRS